MTNNYNQKREEVRKSSLYYKLKKMLKLYGKKNTWKKCWK